jgi:hypothetical protein
LVDWKFRNSRSNNRPQQSSFRRKPESSESLEGDLDFNFAGGSPAAGDFLLLAQKKVTKENGTLVRRSFGLPCAARPAGRLRNSPLPLRGKDSDSPRRRPPAWLCCSAAHMAEACCYEGWIRSRTFELTTKLSRREAAQRLSGRMERLVGRDYHWTSTTRPSDVSQSPTPPAVVKPEESAYCNLQRMVWPLFPNNTACMLPV